MVDCTKPVDSLVDAESSELMVCMRQHRHVALTDACPQNQLFKEFNTLSLVYGRVAKQFVTGVVLDEEEEKKAEEARRLARPSRQQTLPTNSWSRKTMQDHMQHTLSLCLSLSLSTHVCLHRASRSRPPQSPHRRRRRSTSWCIPLAHGALHACAVAGFSRLWRCCRAN